MSGYVRALPAILEAEGGYVDHPADPGGATNYGVTQRVYDSWRRSRRLAARPVRGIDMEEVRAIYHERYWLAAKCDALPWPLSLCHFDAAVNHGVAGAVKMLQRALGVSADGIHGPKTQAAVDAAHPGALYGEWYAERLAYYHGICERRPASRVFLRGWVRRMVHLHKTAKGGAGG